MNHRVNETIELNGMNNQLQKTQDMSQITQFQQQISQQQITAENNYQKARSRRQIISCQDGQIDVQFQKETTKKEQLSEVNNERKNGNSNQDQQKKCKNCKDHNQNQKNQQNQQHNNAGDSKKNDESWDNEENQQNQDQKSNQSGNDQQKDQNQEIDQSSSQSVSSEQKISDYENENIKRLDNLVWKSSTPIDRVKYLNKIPKKILKKLIYRLNQRNLKKKKKYSLEVDDGLNGIFHINVSIFNKKNQLKEKIQIEGNLVQYQESYGIFWRYEEWEFWKWIYTQQFNQILNRMWKKENVKV